VVRTAAGFVPVKLDGQAFARCSSNRLSARSPGRSHKSSATGRGTTVAMSPRPSMIGLTASATVNVVAGPAHTSSSSGSSRKWEVRFACGSRSTTRTRRLSLLIMIARWYASVVLPTRPLLLNSARVITGAPHGNRPVRIRDLELRFAGT